jgi:hypothetical protein
LHGVAGLLSAVADTVGPVGLTAEAGEVVSSALEVGLGNGGHVVDAQ